MLLSMFFYSYLKEDGAFDSLYMSTDELQAMYVTMFVICMVSLMTLFTTEISILASLTVLLKILDQKMPVPSSLCFII